MSRFYIPIIKGKRQLLNLSLIKDVGDYALYYAFAGVDSALIQNVEFSELLNVTGTRALEGLCRLSSYQFDYNNNLASISFPKLTTISGSYGIRDAFYNCTKLTSVSFPNLTTVGNYALNRSFYNCTSLSTISFPKLSATGKLSFGSTFQKCTSLTSISFPKLTSNSFDGTSTFGSMLSGVTGCTVHFPSNLQSVIGSWSDVTNGFGGTNTTVLFDLPATS